MERTKLHTDWNLGRALLWILVRFLWIISIAVSRLETDLFTIHRSYYHYYSESVRSLGKNDRLTLRTYTAYNGSMPVTRVVHSLNKISAEPADSAVNVWHFWHPYALNVLLAQKIGFALSAFYSALNTELSISIDRVGLGGQSMTVSALDAGAAGPDDDVVAPPVYAFNDTLTSGTAPSGLPLPNECSLCLSFSSDLAGVPESANSGTMRPASRRRGRVYLGPWQAVMLGENPTTHEPQVANAKQAKILAAYQVMIVALQNVTDPTDAPQRVSHVVYSPTSGIEWPVTAVWVDQEFDTIRSRGIKGFGKLTDTVVQSQALVS